MTVYGNVGAMYLGATIFPPEQRNIQGQLAGRPDEWNLGESDLWGELDELDKH